MRYINKLFYLQMPENSQVDESGNIIAQVDNLVFACYCRDESNSSGRKVSNGEGSHIEYSLLIFAPQDCPELTSGDFVEVTDQDGRIRFKGSVLRFSRDRYNCRIWV